MSTIKVGINGFGRIGRAFARIAFSKDQSFELVAINTRKTKASMLAYLLQYDSVYRTFGKAVTANNDGILIGGKLVNTTLAATPEEIPWESPGKNMVYNLLSTQPVHLIQNLICQNILKEQ
jgi:glyceraldehyde 3-phosphate dehydrogenase